MTWKNKAAKMVSGKARGKKKLPGKGTGPDPSKVKQVNPPAIRPPTPPSQPHLGKAAKDTSESFPRVGGFKLSNLVSPLDKTNQNAGNMTCHQMRT